VIECWNCEQTFEPNRSRWRCPYCGAKNACCEGEPQQQALFDKDWYTFTIRA
jgi:Zn finger protein HypA/HybF involved in hydrogenase expression